jgi:hypothetical protein
MFTRLDRQVDRPPPPPAASRVDTNVLIDGVTYNFSLRVSADGCLGNSTGHDSVFNSG